MTVCFNRGSTEPVQACLPKSNMPHSPPAVTRAAIDVVGPINMTHLLRAITCILSAIIPKPLQPDQISDLVIDLDVDGTPPEEGVAWALFQQRGDYVRVQFALRQVRLAVGALPWMLASAYQGEPIKITSEVAAGDVDVEIGSAGWPVLPRVAGVKSGAQAVRIDIGPALAAARKWSGNDEDCLRLALAAWSLALARVTYRDEYGVLIISDRQLQANVVTAGPEVTTTNILSNGSRLCTEETIVSCEVLDHRTTDVDGVTFSRVDVPSVPSGMLLHLSIDCKQGQALVNYDPGRITRQTAAMVADAYDRLLRAMADSGDAVPSSIALGPSPIGLPHMECRKTIIDLFKAQVDQTPDSVALVYKECALSYRELDQAVDRLANRLVADGIEWGTVVAVALPRSPVMIITILAVLRVGAIYLPLDLAYPQFRIQFIVEDSGCNVVIVNNCSENLPEMQGVKVINLDGNSDYGEADTAWCGPKPDDAAYIIYTSGSTGRPKGVVVEHGSAANLVTMIGEDFQYRTGSRVLQFASPSFDASIIEILGTLCNGGTLCLADNKDLLPGTVLADTLLQMEISSVTLTPSVLRVTSPARLQQLQTVVSAGEECDFEIVAAWGQERKFINAYGPTEATVCATLDICELADAEWLMRPPVGRPIGGVSVYVLDGYQLPVPPGALGELHIGGQGVARGYLGRPQLTRERFVADPFSEGGRMYRTGDLVRQLPDGRIEFIGRVDQQVKIRGYRIELGEIECVLRDFQGIEDAAVVPEGERLVAFVTGTANPEQVRRWAGNRLPDYMVPATVTVIDNLPLTQSGKVDKNLLLEWALPEAVAEEREFGSVRQVVAQVFTMALGISPGGDDNFFELGGHSLTATGVICHLNAQFRVDLTERDIFENSTVDQLTAVVERAIQRGSKGLPPLVKADRSELLPLSLPQERVWFIQRMHPENIAYQAQAVIAIRGALKVDVLERVLTEIVRRHEMFRTTFHDRDGRPYQKIWKPWVVNLSCCDVSLEDDPVQAVDQMVQRLVRHRFDMEKLPLVRWSLIKSSATEYQLVYVEHHLVHDGWSFTVFMSELIQLYTAFAGGQPSPLPELEFQFADYASWQRMVADSKLVEEQMKYWIERLSPPPDTLELPADRKRPPVESFVGDALRVRLDPEIVGAARGLCQGSDLTLFMVMLAVFNVLLFRYTGNRHIVLATGIANRRRPELDNMIGMVINTLPLDNRVSPDMTFQEFLLAVRDSTLDAFAHQDVPVDRLVRELYQQRQADRNPLFAVMFSFHDSPLPELECPGLNLEVTEGINNGSAKFDLNIVGIPRSGDDGDGMTMIWEFSTEIFDRATVERMYKHFQVLAREALQRPDKTLKELPVMTEQEHVRIIDEWNKTDMPVTDVCLHQVVEQWASRQPDRVAATGCGLSLTYGELKQQADVVAEHLRVAGAGRSGPVAILMPRSPQMIVAMIAAHKVGAAYVPLDPTYPSARLQYMISDSQAAVVVCTSESRQQLSTDVQILPMDTIDLTQKAQLPEINVCPDDPAYIIYTSGTTGQPKGVACSHRSVMNLLTDFERRQPLSPDDRCSFWTSPGFDVAVYEIFSALTAGAHLNMAPDEVRFHDELFIKWLCDHQVTSAYVPPFMLPKLREQASDSGLALRRLLVGVEPISHRLLRDINEALPDLVLINGYGPTETTICATLHTVTSTGAERPFAPIGKPVAGARIYLLDDCMNPVPIGVPGRLYIGGIGLAIEYYRQPQLTREKFIVNPFVADGSLMYDSGDIARYLPIGDIEFIGRADDQLKIRGFRIEPGEIEYTLTLHPLITEAVVIPWTAGAEQQLAAYIVPGEKMPDVNEVRRFVSERLPQYMIPTAYVVLDKLPVTAHGKVDRTALPEPAAGQGSRCAEPRTEQEQVVLEIWQQMLGKQDIRVDDDFFAVGGHSLVAMQIISRMEQALHVTVPLRLLFTYPTVASLCSQLPLEQTEQDWDPRTVDVAAALEQIDTLSDEQVQALLDFLSEQEVEQ